MSDVPLPACEHCAQIIGLNHELCARCKSDVDRAVILARVTAERDRAWVLVERLCEEGDWLKPDDDLRRAVLKEIRKHRAKEASP